MDTSFKPCHLVHPGFFARSPLCWASLPAPLLLSTGPEHEKIENVMIFVCLCEMCVCARVFGCNGPPVWPRGLSVSARANGRLPYIKWVFSGSPGCMYCMWSSVQWSGGRAAPRAPLHFPIENPWLAAEGEPHTRPRGRRAREVSAPQPQPVAGALPALSVFRLTCEPPGCSPKDSAAGAAAAAAAAGRVDLRKTEGTPRAGRRRQPARSPGTFPLRQNFGSGEVGGEGRGGRAGGGRGARRQCPAGGRLGAGLGSSRPAGARLRLQPAPLGAQAAPPERGARGPGRGQEPPEENNNSPHAGGRLVAARGAPNFILAKVRGSPPGRGCRGGGAWGAGAGEEGTGRQPSVDPWNVSCASVTGSSSPGARSSGELGLGCSGPADRCPRTPPHPNARRVEKVLF